MNNFNNSIITTFVCAVIVPTTCFADLTQWRAEDGGNDHYYGITSIKGTWDITQAEAVVAGGNLASISSAAENEFIRLLIPVNSSAPGNAAWIGLSRPNGGQWEWADGTEFAYSNWGAGEPNNARGNEYWSWMYGPHTNNAGGLWNDHPQWDYQMFGVIEVTPAPGAAALIGLSGLLIRRRRA